MGMRGGGGGGAECDVGLLTERALDNDENNTKRQNITITNVNAVCLCCCLCALFVLCLVSFLNIVVPNSNHQNLPTTNSRPTPPPLLPPHPPPRPILRTQNFSVSLLLKSLHLWLRQILIRDLVNQVFGKPLWPVLTIFPVLVYQIWHRIRTSHP